MIFPDTTLPIDASLLLNISWVLLLLLGIAGFGAILWTVVEGWDLDHPVRTPVLVSLVILPIVGLVVAGFSAVAEDRSQAEQALVEQAEEVYGLEINQSVTTILLEPVDGLSGLGNQPELLRKHAGTVSFLSDGKNLMVTLVWTGAEWVLVEGSEVSDGPREELPRVGDVD